MLSMTDMDAPTISLATPEDVKAASEKAMNVWVGALSPLWVPFWAASAVGVGVWALAQGLKRGALGPLDIDADAPLVTKWPGYALPFATPWSKGWGEAAIELDEAVELVKDTVAEPLQLAIEAEQKLEGALFPVAEAATQTAAFETKTAVEAVTTEAETVAPEMAPAPDAPVIPAVKKTAKPAAAAPLLDPATETPVVPDVAEATAEITPELPMPTAARPSSIPPLAPVPRRPEPKSSKPKKR